MNLQVLRKRRRAVLKCLMPALLSAWVVAAAAPCAAMTHEHASTTVETGHAHHAMPPADAGLGQTAPGPLCPHCGDHKSGDSAAHAACGAGDAAIAKDQSFKVQKRDLTMSLIGPSFEVQPLPRPDLIESKALEVTAPVSPRPPHLRFCVFLN